MNALDSLVVATSSTSSDVLPKEEIEATRTQALLRIGPEELLTLTGKALVSVQAVLGHGAELGRWTTPRRWCPTGIKAKLSLDIRMRLLDLLPDQSVRPKAATGYGKRVLEHAVEALTRYLIVLRMGPASMRQKRAAQPLDPSVIADSGYYISSQLFAIALMRWLQSRDEDRVVVGEFLRIVRNEDLATLTKSQQEKVLAEARRMQSLLDRGWWTDLPMCTAIQTVTTDVAGDAPSASKERKRDSHLPLPDAYVSEMGNKSLWLIESLAPNLLQIAESICTIWQDTDVDDIPPQTIRNRRRKEVSKLLDSWEWKDSNGNLIERPPFPILLSRSGEKKATVNDKTDEKLESLHWPPRKLASVLGLLGNVQLAHLFVVSLSTGGRKSETMDLRRGCVEYSRDGRPYANGRTFKLVRRHDGEMRDWVLPDLAVISLEQQGRLVQVVERIGLQKPDRSPKQKSSETIPSDHLWVQVSGGAMSDRSQPLLHLDKAMRAYATSLSMDTKPGNQLLRPHRFRKTVARLAALALAQAPKILMNVFGHKSIEMTLYYILSDKDLQADIEKVSRELRVMRAEETVSAIVAAEEHGTEGISLGGYGGPAALMVSRAIQRQKERIHRSGEDWDAGSVRELAEILTLQGKAWELVRHGVICTKLPGTEAGPCNKSKGRPEPSKCQTACNHRLEEAFVREDVDGAISSCIEEFSAATEAQDELMQALWAGQIRAHVSRFSDLRVKWSAHPLVQQLLADQAEATTA